MLTQPQPAFQAGSFDVLLTGRGILHADTPNIDYNQFHLLIPGPMSSYT